MYSDSVEAYLKKRGISVGDEISLKSSAGEFKGILMPRPESGDSSILVIKQGNGYNIGIRFDANVEIERIPKNPASFEFPKSDIKKNDLLPKISMIYTGGTIGSKVDYLSGGVYMLTKPEELLYEIPEIGSIANVDVNNLMSIASEDMTYKEWQKIASEVASALNKGSRGVVITHGTDTMHYTSAALSFMLQGLNGPVVITGAQRSSDRGSSDAFMNVICSFYAAAKSDIAEVGICMHATSSDTECSFIRGTKARKMHTSRRDAFQPVNDRAIASISYDGTIKYFSDYSKISEERNGTKVKALTAFEPKVALVKAYPNSDPEIIDYYLSKGYKGIIIEGTGLGHTAVSTPHKEYSWLDAIKNAVDKGAIVGMTSQCLYGRVNANVYRNLRLLHGAGVIYCEDMLPEVAYVKLGFLLGNYKKEEAAKLLSINIAGEIKSRSRFDYFLK